MRNNEDRPKLLVGAFFSDTKDRGVTRDEIVDAVARTTLFRADDLIRLVNAGVRQLPTRDKEEFMARLWIELNKNQDP
jgi:hypothetical protein